MLKTIYVAKKDSELLDKIKEEFANELIETPTAYAVFHRRFIDFLSKNLLWGYPKDDKDMQKSIAQKLKDYFQESNYIDIQGFENFRLKEEKEAIEKQYFESQLQDEYWDFINLLRYFVSIEPPKENCVDVYIGKDGNYKLINENSLDITRKYAKEFMPAKEEGVVNSGDVLISMLIAISPEMLKIHKIENLKNNDLTKTLKNVFADKLMLCCGCRECSE